MPPPLKGIQLSNYRNFINKKEIFNFDHTLFKGKNAVGKTNLLESISFLSPGTGFRKDAIQNFIFQKQEMEILKMDMADLSSLEFELKGMRFLDILLFVSLCDKVFFLCVN
mgnify:CR=1 FL=1